jgi:hypothetical protein
VRRRTLRKRYGRSHLAGGRAADVAPLVKLLKARGYREPLEHARAFVRGGYDARQLLASEIFLGHFPKSSPRGPLVLRRRR